MAYEPPQPILDFLADWRRVEPMAQRDYVKSELVRLAAAGAHVLTQVLTLDLEVKTHVAMRVLAEDNPIPDHRWYVRLIEGAVPHSKDPQGRDIKPPKLGNVEIVKVGTKGGQLRQSHTLPGSVTDQYNSIATQAAAARGADIYVCREIGHDPVELSLNDAVVVLSKYGFGIPIKRYWGKTLTSDGWDSWIIAEVHPAEAEGILLEKRARDRAARKTASAA